MSFTREQFALSVMWFFVGYFIGFGMGKMRR